MIKYDLSIIIVNWNTKQMLLDCINSIYGTVRKTTFEIIIVDNGSSDGSVEAVRSAFPGATVIANGANLGFAKANNIGIKRMKGAYAVLLNSDTVLKEEALDTLFAFMETHPKAGMCGPRLLNEDGTRQKSFGVFPALAGEFTSKRFLKIFFPRTYRKLFLSDNADFKNTAAVDFIMGACMMVRKQAMDRAGTLDEDYFFFYEEIDWCRRMRDAGWPVYHVPNAEIYHLGGGSTKKVSLRARAESWRSRYLYFRKSLSLSRFAVVMLFLAGLAQVLFRFTGYTALNALSAFSANRLRRRWTMFGYLFLWHLRGMPVSMCLPR